MTRKIFFFLIISAILLLISCRSYQIRPGDIPSENQGVGFIKIYLSGIDNLKVVTRIDSNGKSLSLIKGEIKIFESQSNYAIFLKEDDYYISGFYSSKDDGYSAGIHFSKSPRFSVKKKYNNFIGACDFELNELNYILTCTNDPGLYEEAIVNFSKEFPELAKKFPFRNGANYDKVVIKGKLVKDQVIVIPIYF
jgi:hypothetical protein